MSGPRVVLVASALAAALPALPVARADEAGQAGASTPAAYPAEPTARPLLVPRGATEAGLALVVERLDLGDGAASAFALAPRVRHAIGPTELAAAAALSLGEVAPAGVRAPTRDRLRALALGARWRLDDDRALGVELELGLDGLRAITPRLAFERRWRLRRAALTAGAGLGLEHTEEDPGQLEPSVLALVVDGEARVEAALAPAVIVEAHARLRLRRPTELRPDEGHGNTSLTLEPGLGVLVALGRALELFATVDVVADGEREQQRFTIGVVARRLR